MIATRPEQRHRHVHLESKCAIALLHNLGHDLGCSRVQGPAQLDHEWHKLELA